MTSNQRKATIAESVIGLFLLLVLFLIAAGVFVKHLDWDMGRFGIEQAVSTKEPSKVEKTDLSGFLPGGFSVMSQVERYEPENLFEKINGKAPLYLEAGFKELRCQRFANQADEKLIFEAYMFDMATARNAFSVYSTQRRAGTDDLTGVKFGYKTSNGAYFASGKFYIEMVGYSESQGLLEAIVEAARNIEAKLADDSEIAELSLLEANNLVSGSVKFYTAGAFGFEGFTETFSGRYETDGERVTAFLSRRADAEQARTLAQSYKRFLIENGAKEKNPINNSLQGRVFDFYGTIEIVFSTGIFTVGIHEAENQQAAEKTALQFLERLENQQDD